MALHELEKVGVGRTAEVFAWGEGRVLKLFRDWAPARWLEEERRGTEAAHQAGLPAPAVYGVETVDGRQGIVLERIEGPSLLSALSARPWRALWAARLLAEVHASIHAKRVSLPGATTLRERLLWQFARSGLSEDVQRRAEAALARLPDADVLCHYDLHPDNVILTRSGPVVIDWGPSCPGDPLADVARTSLMLRIGCGPEGPPGPVVSGLRRLLLGSYLRRYLALTGASREGLAAWDLPIAVARASDHIEPERPALLARIGRLVAGR
jgi:aminoglycoside phosphotransferase (APT) family kinase protein